MDGTEFAASVLVEDAPPICPDMPDMSRSYDRYIGSGLYDDRYPRPNRRTLRTLRQCLPAGGRFLDIGCGTGRYTMPLLEMTGTIGVAQDICPVARGTVSERTRRYAREGRLEIRGDAPDVLAREYRRSFDLVLLAFGVLAHVPGRSERLQLLRAARDLLKSDGTLVLGLPNARRRFRREQRVAAPLVSAGELETGDILYRRGQGDGEIRMFYHLYTDAEARRDLSAAGFRLGSVEPESLLSETAVVHGRLIGWLDDLICRLVPATLGYGLLVVGRPDTALAA